MSTRDQDMARQFAALQQAGATRIYSEKVSGATRDKRPALARMLDDCRAGDVVIVQELSRLGRSLLDLVTIVADLGRRGVEFRSLAEPFMDTTTPGGKLIFYMFGALAEFEREQLRQRVLDGLAASDKKGGRPRALSPKKAELASEWSASGVSNAEIARRLKISPRTVGRLLGPRRRHTPRRRATELAADSGPVTE